MVSVAHAKPPSAPSSETLRANLRRAEARRRLVAMALVAPLFAFVFLVFVVPLGFVLYFSVDDREVPTYMPRTARALADWDGATMPGEPVFAALVEDLRRGYADKTIAKAAMRLNYEVSGFRSMVMRTARRARRIEQPPYRDAVIDIEPRWGEIDYWRSVKAALGPVTSRYLLAAVDLERQWDGSVGRAPPERTLYIDYLGRTFWISLWVVVICIAIGYPIAYLIATSRGLTARLLLLLVLLPFWTSLLVRTTAWVILLQKEGVVNGVLVGVGLVDEPMQLIFNRFGVYVAMAHILLPFLVLPLYSVMVSIPPSHMRAAASLGATPLSSFLSVYLPQTMPGLVAGCTLVFILCLGFYITPALVGGPRDQMLSYLIAEFATRTGNWGMSSAIAVILLLSVVLLIPVARRFLSAGALGVRS